MSTGNSDGGIGGGLLDNGAFVCFMTIALSGLGVLMAYAIFSRFSQKPKDKDPSSDAEQAQYMREVRLRYQGSMANANGYGRKWLMITGEDGMAPGYSNGHGAARESEMSYV